MPAGDRTGPRGEGPKTGRALGYCSGSDSPGYMNPAPGLGRGGGGFGRGGGLGRGGGGRGHRNVFYATGLPRWARGRGYVPEYRDYRDPGTDDLESLKREAGALEARLRSVIERIESMEKDPGKENG